jgi:spore maturation protein CgeB
MRLVVFGLTVSSSWGNGHATLWRGLCRALAGRGHQVTFFEREVSYYATHRDLRQPPGYELLLYEDWKQIEPRARQAVAQADSAIVTSLLSGRPPRKRINSRFHFSRACILRPRYPRSTLVSYGP